MQLRLATSRTESESMFIDSVSTPHLVSQLRRDEEGGRGEQNVIFVRSLGYNGFIMTTDSEHFDDRT